MTAYPKDLLNVLVVDDSAFARRTISKIIEEKGKVHVIGSAYDGEDAIKKVVLLKPDFITLDLEMPNLDGFAFLRWLMVNRPTPVLVVTSKGSNRSVFKALDLGAIDFVIKPTSKASVELFKLKEQIRKKIAILKKLNFSHICERVKDPTNYQSKVEIPQPKQYQGNAEIVAIGCSTGGPSALQMILTNLPPDLLAPVVVAQHMPPVFTGLFAERLNRLSPLTVREARNNDTLAPSNVYIAPGAKQMRILMQGAKVSLLVGNPSPTERFAPSIDVLFETVANTYSEKAIAIILTGMGDDGARGISEIQRKRGYTIAESQETAAVFGMPERAIETGAINEVLPLYKIPGAILKRAKCG